MSDDTKDLLAEENTGIDSGSAAGTTSVSEEEQDDALPAAKADTEAAPAAATGLEERGSGSKKLSGHIIISKT